MTASLLRNRKQIRSAKFMEKRNSEALSPRLNRSWRWLAFLAATFAAGLVFPFSVASAQSAQFTILFPASVSAKPITGRLFVIVTKTDRLEPRIQQLSEGAPPFFGIRSGRISIGWANCRASRRGIRTATCRKFIWILPRDSTFI